MFFVLSYSCNGLGRGLHGRDGAFQLVYTPDNKGDLILSLLFLFIIT